VREGAPRGLSGDLGNDTETGGGGGEIFHGSQSVGADQIMDLSYAQGRPGGAGPGATFMTAQIGANTVVEFGDGGEMVLMGVQLSTLPSHRIFRGFQPHL
jgi:hypothetical protein